MIEKITTKYPDFDDLKYTVNQLVDAVNELQNMQVQVNDHELKIASIYDQLNGFRAVMRENGWNIDWTYPEHIADASKMIDPAENVQDKFAEQRKWIGKLCRFRDKDYKDDQWDYGLLQAVEKAETAHIWKTGCFKHNLGHWYDFCEPVKPDDDIIYKGGDNE